MRILHILDHSLPLHSGYTFRTLAVLRQQRKLGWETIHLTGAKQGGRALEENVDGWHFFRTAPITRWWARLPVLRQVAVVAGLSRRLWQLASVTRPHVLHAHSPALNALAALRVGRALGIPVVYEIRAFWEDAAADAGTSAPGGLRYRLSRALETYVMRRSDALTTICAGLRDDIVRRGIAGNKVTIVPNAVDSEQFPSGASDRLLAEQMGLGGHIVLGFIGSFYHYEGLALLIDAMPRLLVHVPPLLLLLAGGGPQEQALRAQVARLGLEGKVRFAGRLPPRQVGACYQSIDVLVYPRLPMRLTELVTPLKPLEAMALGRLVVASDVGGHRELIEHGRTGLLFEAGNADALVDRLLQLLRDTASWPGLRERARRYAREERNWDGSVARYAGIYQRLLAVHAP